MRNIWVTTLALLSTAALGAPPSGAGGPPAGVSGPGMGGSMMGGTMRDSFQRGRPESMVDYSRTERPQRALRQSQLESGAWQKLQDRTGMSSEELQSMYEGSGARNFGEFTAAIMVSKNLGLDPAAVLEGLKTDRLGRTLVNLGIDENTAKAEVRRAEREIGG